MPSDVFTRTELLSGNPHRSPYARAYLNTFHPKNSGDVLILYKPNLLVGAATTGTDHGMPYEYDSHVPLVLAGPGVARGSVKTRARTVDIGPTLARLLGLPVPPNLDGRPLIEPEPPSSKSATPAH